MADVARRSFGETGGVNSALHISGPIAYLRAGSGPDGSV